MLFMAWPISNPLNRIWGKFQMHTFIRTTYAHISTDIATAKTPSIVPALINIFFCTITRHITQQRRGGVILPGDILPVGVFFVDSSPETNHMTQDTSTGFRKPSFAYWSPGVPISHFDITCIDNENFHTYPNL